MTAEIVKIGLSVAKAAAEEAVEETAPTFLEKTAQVIFSKMGKAVISNTVGGLIGVVITTPINKKISEDYDPKTATKMQVWGHDLKRAAITGGISGTCVGAISLALDAAGNALLK